MNLYSETVYFYPIEEMKKSYEGTELWPFESSTSSTASTPKRTSKDRRFANDQPSTIENAGGGGETDSLSSTQPITYSAFGVTISTFKGLLCLLIY